MNKNKIIAISLLFSLIFLICGCSTNKEKFKVTYNKIGLDKTVVVINVEGNNVNLTCSGPECGETSSKKYKFSRDNIKKLTNYLKSFNKGSNFKLNEEELEDNQKQVVESIFYGEYTFELAVEESLYSGSYRVSEQEIYKVYYKKDNTILVKQIVYGNKTIRKINSYTLDFEVGNTKKIAEFLKNGKDNYRLSDYNTIYSSIISKNESSLDSINLNYNALLSMSYNDNNCITPVVKLYDDHYYEVYSKDKVISEGRINIDTNVLIESLKDDAEDEYSEKPFIINNKGTIYEGKENNDNIRLLIDKVNVNIKNCIN